MDLILTVAKHYLSSLHNKLLAMTIHCFDLSSYIVSLGFFERCDRQSSRWHRRGGYNEIAPE